MKEKETLCCSKQNRISNVKKTVVVPNLTSRTEDEVPVHGVHFKDLKEREKAVTKHILSVHVDLTTLENGGKDAQNYDNKDDDLTSHSVDLENKIIDTKQDCENISPLPSPHLTSIDEEAISNISDDPPIKNKRRCENAHVNIDENHRNTYEATLSEKCLTNDRKDSFVRTSGECSTAKPRVRPKSSCARSSSTRSSLDSCRPFSAMQSGRYTSRSTARSRASTAPSFRITKEDLEVHLPRKSYFNCHDKTLKDAGYEVEVVSGAQKRKKELLIILQKIRDNRHGAKTTFGRPQTNIIKVIAEGDTETDVTDGQSITLDESQPQNASTQKGIQKRQVKSAKKKSEYDEEEVRVDDYQPLLQYLKHVKENPDDYLSSRSQNASSNLVEVRPGDRIIQMGSIFQRGQHGLPSDSTLVNAAHDIRQRFCDPGQWTSTSKEKTLLNLTSAKKESVFNQNKESHESNQTAEEPKSEYEIRKKKMEAWLKTISTAQLNKAKELALRDLGEEDRSLSKWWQSLKSCHYIR